MKAAKSPQDLINNLPVPEELKAHLKRNVGNESMSDRIMKMLQDASGVELPTGETAADKSAGADADATSVDVSTGLPKSTEGDRATSPQPAILSDQTVQIKDVSSNLIVNPDANAHLEDKPGEKLEEVKPVTKTGK
jgi:hypothetical protein